MSVDHPSNRLPSVASAFRNADYIEELYEIYQQNPDALPESWRIFFQGFELAMCPHKCVAAEQAEKQSQINALIAAYRCEGHLLAKQNPLSDVPIAQTNLEPSDFGFSSSDLDQVFNTGTLVAPSRAPLQDILDVLQQTYCGHIGVEYMHIQDREIKNWLQQRMEGTRNRPEFDTDKRLGILKNLTDAELFENFLHTHYPGQKRFSLEGAETMIPAMHALVEAAPEAGVAEIVFGMPHRGRLNFLANILNKSIRMIFSEFEDNYMPETVYGAGDVKYHRGYSSDYKNRYGRSIHLSLTSNPSHLEAVNPVVEGRARAKQRQRNDTERRSTVLPVIIHGDAGFAGQGIVAETLNLSQLPGYRTGGTIHFIINNQIGFTALPEEARSSVYTTDVAKMIEAPIFHVNGDDPEAVVYVMEMALDFRQRFQRDVVVDMVCYRRHGHNEADDPAFTQPLMYEQIRKRPSVRKLYENSLVEVEVIAEAEAKKQEQNVRKRLKEAFGLAKEGEVEQEQHAFSGLWKGLENPFSHDPVNTAVSKSDLLTVGRALTGIPDGFQLNRKIAQKLPDKLERIELEGEIDWALAEQLAFGTLLKDGVPVRLSGQDSARGTFSQRHAVWVDGRTQQHYKPLNHISNDQAHFCVYNSLLSEAAVLGFDYGYSLAEPRMLILWEAQFGDFVNGAQVILDQFIAGALSKWQRSSGLVLLLPHGFEGQGPEHSNAYLERYLTACADNNLQVCNVTTPAQYFHLLRRQMMRPFRRPLIIMAPKSLLRHPAALSPISDFTQGRFQEFLDDSHAPERPKHLILTSGKLYYDLVKHRETLKDTDSAILRIEQLYPFNDAAFAPIARRYRNVKSVVWAQEEPMNRGGWNFMHGLLAAHFPDRPLHLVSRPASASPAVGSLSKHRKEQEELVRKAFEG